MFGVKRNKHGTIMLIMLIRKCGFAANQTGRIHIIVCYEAFGTAE